MTKLADYQVVDDGQWLCHPNNIPTASTLTIAALHALYGGNKANQVGILASRVNTPTHQRAIQEVMNAVYNHGAEDGVSVRVMLMVMNHLYPLLDCDSAMLRCGQEEMRRILTVGYAKTHKNDDLATATEKVKQLAPMKQVPKDQYTLEVRTPMAKFANDPLFDEHGMYKVVLNTTKEGKPKPPEADLLCKLYINSLGGIDSILCYHNSGGTEFYVWAGNLRDGAVLGEAGSDRFQALPIQFVCGTRQIRTGHCTFQCQTGGQRIRSCSRSSIRQRGEPATRILRLWESKHESGSWTGRLKSTTNARCDSAQPEKDDHIIDPSPSLLQGWGRVAEKEHHQRFVVVSVHRKIDVPQ